MWRLLPCLFLFATMAGAQPTSESPPSNLIVVATLTPISSSQTLFMNASVGVDATEGNIAIPLGHKMTFRNLACTTSEATSAGKDVVVTGRAGPCGIMGDIPAFTATILGGVTPGFGTSGTISLTIPSGQCFALKVTTPAALPASIRVNCSLERSA